MAGQKDTITERVEQRVGAKVGLFIHAGVWFAVNLLLFIVNFLTAPEMFSNFKLMWFYWPLIFWGIGLIIHAIVTSAICRAKKWETEERTKEEAAQRNSSAEIL